MGGMPRNRRLAVALVSVTLVATACGDDDDSANETVPVAATTLPETTVLETTLPDTTEVATTATVPGSTLPIAEVVTLDADGIGVAAFGDEPEAVIAAATELLGEPTEDSGWSEPLDISSCPGTQVRRVSWGALSLYFGDESTIVQGTPHLFSYSYGAAGDLEVEPVGLTTPEGIGLGATVEYLRAAHPDATVEPGEEGVIEPSFYVNDTLSGRLTGGVDDDLVTLIIGGDPCGV